MRFCELRQVTRLSMRWIIHRFLNVARNICWQRLHAGCWLLVPLFHLAMCCPTAPHLIQAPPLDTNTAEDCRPLRGQLVSISGGQSPCVLMASYAGQSVNSGTERGKNPLTDAVRRAEQNKHPPRLHHHLTPQGGLNISEKDGAYCSPV